MLLATQLHHVKTPFRRGEETDLALAFDPANVEPLCEPCHIKHHKRERRAVREECHRCGSALEKGVCEFCRMEGWDKEEVE